MNLVRYILLASVFLTLAAGSARAQGLTEYTDDFSTDKARSDCYFSSIFWPGDINCPPACPYLFYYSAGDARGLAFMNYGEELAQLMYSFVVSATATSTAVRGTLWLDVSFPCNTEIAQFPPGQLLCSTSADGLTWSVAQSLQAGHQGININVPSAKSTCYVLLAGTRAVIDNLQFSPVVAGSTVRISHNGGTRDEAVSMILHVDGSSGRDTNDGHNRANAFATIQKAINMAWDGDTVVVWPGVYQEEIVLKGKAITVQSAADAAVITAPNGYAFSFYDAEGPATIVTNFVIAGCKVAGIFCLGSSPTLRNLTITGNQAGVVAYGGANPYIVNSIIWGNASGQLSAWKANFNWRVYYSCIGADDPRNPNNLSKTAGNIRVDPKFADSPNEDYHLKSPWGRYVPWTDTWVTTDREFSPCIDTGDPSDSPRGERVPNGGRIDMGAHGGTPYASLSSGPLCK